MASRNRTSFFLEHRSKMRAHRGSRPKIVEMSVVRSGFSEREGQKKQQLLEASSDQDVRVGIDSVLPPPWVDLKDEVELDIEAVRGRMADLAECHRRHLLVKFDDEEDEEGRIEIITREITRILHKSEGKVKMIGRSRTSDSKSEDAMMRRNVQANLALRLQDVSKEFRASQKHYLQRMKGLREKDYGDALEPEEGGTTALAEDLGFTEGQVAMLETNDQVVSERMREIEQIASSINDLAEIMKELSILVIDQGSILDRIDFNVEAMAETMEEAVGELTKAEKHQKRGLRMCMIVLIVMIVILGVILAFRVSN